MKYEQYDVGFSCKIEIFAMFYWIARVSYARIIKMAPSNYCALFSCSNDRIYPEIYDISNIQKAKNMLVINGRDFLTIPTLKCVRTIL